MTFNFDMDGTIADLYGVENWLFYLRNADPYPYEEARPLLNMSVLARLLNRLIENGHEVNIISWLSKTSTEDYDEEVITAKLEWLGTHLKSVKFNKICIVPYGTPKHLLANGILFDDEEKNRSAWGEGAYDVDNIIDTLKSFL